MTTTLIVGLLIAVGVLGLVAIEGWLLHMAVGQSQRLQLRAAALEAGIARRSYGRFTERQPGPAIVEPAGPRSTSGGGAIAPEFRLPDLHGRPVTLGDLRAGGRPVALIVTDPRCGPCAEILTDVAGWQRDHVDRLTVALVSAGTPEANRAHLAGHQIERVLLQAELEFVDAYGLSQAPAAILVRPDGTLDGAAVYGSQAIRAAIAHAIGAPLPGPVAGPVAEGSPVGPLAVGDPLPDLRLPDLEGTLVNLAGLTGVPRIVLFWSPHCGHCQSLLDDLRSDRAVGASDVPPLVVIARGTAETNRALDLAVPVLLDDGLAASRAFGVRGTPSALVIGPDGRIASEVARGSGAVRALLAAV